MKKLLVVLLAVLMLFALAACNNATTDPTDSNKPPASESGNEGGEPKPSEGLIGISVPGATHGWVAATAYFSEKTAKELGVNYKLVVSANPVEQANQLTELVEMGCDVIVLFPHNNEVTVAAQSVLDAGVPLINFDRIVNVDSTAYLAGDNPGMGTEGGKYIEAKLGGEGKVIILGVPSWGDINTERVNAFKAYVAEHAPGIEIINEYAANTAAQEDGLTVMADALTANERIDAVFSVDDELSIGIQKAIEEANRTDVKVVTGGGGMQEYFNLLSGQKDIWFASALYHPSMISECVKMAKDLLDGKEIAKTTIIPSVIVDRDNVGDYLDANSPY